MTWADLCAALSAVTNGPWANIRGPGHGPEDRSLGIRLCADAPNGFIAKSFANDDEDECRAYVLARVKKITGEPHALMQLALRRELAAERAEADEVEANDGPAARAETAELIWKHARSPEGSLVEEYLTGRGLSLDSTEAIRWSPFCLWGRETVPCMVALIRDAVTGAALGIHRTELHFDGTRGDRRILGRARRGVVMLHPATPHLGVAEGVETALAAHQLSGLPLWAALSSWGLARLPIIPGIEHLTIFADNDEAGLLAAAELAERYKSAGIEGEIRYPPKPGDDWNDYSRYHGGPEQNL